MKILQETTSLCPQCLRRVKACYREAADGSVELSRVCPDHGEFAVCVWPSRAEAPDIPAFADWKVTKTPSYPVNPATELKGGCPFDCGLCPAHAQHTCTGLVEVTMRCNLSCPVCYAASGEESCAKDPARSVVSGQLRTLLERSGPCNVQLSGGEPTLRDDLPDIVREARALGFPLVQVNTNGIRLARDRAYVAALAGAGLDSVYLQWDSVREKPLAQLRGNRVPDLLALKEQAIANCAEQGLGVVLVTTVVRGVNDDELGNLLRDAVGRGAVVRGLHVQPAAFIGRSPWNLLKSPRMTLGHVMQALADQAPEWIRADHFHPPCCEHSLCSFSSVYARVGGGLVHERTVTALHDQKSVSAAEGARVAKAFVARQWARPDPAKSSGEASPCCSTAKRDAFSLFLEKRAASRRFTLSGMAFQDALSVDIGRLRGCCIHVVRPDGRMVPFCAQNLTSLGGAALYPDRLVRRS